MKRRRKNKDDANDERKQEEQHLKLCFLLRIPPPPRKPRSRSQFYSFPLSILFVIFNLSRKVRETCRKKVLFSRIVILDDSPDGHWSIQAFSWKGFVRVCFCHNKTLSRYTTSLDSTMRCTFNQITWSDYILNSRVM